MNCRKAVAAALLMLMALGILPCAYLEAPTPASGVPGGITCSIEPLQVCDHGDSLLGTLANLPVLVPGATVLILSLVGIGLVPADTSFVPDGFRPSLDHPPQLSA